MAIPGTSADGGGGGGGGGRRGVRGENGEGEKEAVGSSSSSTSADPAGTKRRLKERGVSVGGASSGVAMASTRKRRKLN